MQSYALADDFVDLAAERGIIAAVTRDPALYWEIAGALPAHAFLAERPAWDALTTTIVAEAPTQELPADWLPVTALHATAARLVDLYQRRQLADAQERLARALFDETRPAREIAAQLEEEAARAQATIEYTAAEQLTWASDLIAGVLRSAEERKAAKDLTGRAFTGITSGILSLDLTINGLDEGLIMLGGPPTIGKTTLALNFTGAAAQDTVIVYVTYENPAANLVLKGLAAKASINTTDVSRGTVDLNQLRRGADLWRKIAERLVIIEGNSQTTIAQIRARARQAMNHAKTDRCLIIIDYLQRAAKASQELRSLGSVRERVEVLSSDLRDLAMMLRSPVLAISAQNRASGSYGDGGGAAAMDSLKDSGDLEYNADVLLFLTKNKERMVLSPAEAVDLTVIKNRYGETAKIPLIFRKDLGQFAEVEKRR